jgi:hypothetical protein|tara:strand:+ start:890 stop:1399 length:510 start_codon:yes stop_codon:yes gene_type:complete
MIKKVSILTIFILFGCAGLPTGSVGPQGEPGPAGPKGPIGPKGAKGNDGKSVSQELIEKIEKSLSTNNSESIVGSTAYSFGIAPRITGFAYLTSLGKIYKLENKNPQQLGKSIEFVTQISKTKKFISLGRTTYGDDIIQFFTAVTQSGKIFTSEDLKSWNENANIPISD